MSGAILRAITLFIGWTLRWRFVDPHGQRAAAPGQPILITFWHNRIFLLPVLYRYRWPARRAHRVAVLISASEDGEKLAQVLSRFDMTCVRGSSSRRGREALRELIRQVTQGSDIGITPDGPRGPKYQAQPGVISLAQLTGAPIVPVSYTLSRQITLKTWDAFMIPLPFARCTARFGAPITVPRDADEALRENKRLELESVLKSLSET